MNPMRRGLRAPTHSNHTASALKTEGHEMLLIAKEAPDFSAEAVMPDNRIQKDFSLSSLRGRDVILLFYPLDFSFVCPTELLAFDAQIDDFKSRDAEVVGISVDSAHAHLAWKKQPVEDGGIGPIRFPMVSDLNKKISEAYGVLMEEGMALRAMFLIDREGIVRHATLNDLPLGRNVAEALRTLDAWQFYRRRGHLCPVNWQKGDRGIPESNDGAVDFLSQFAKTG